MTEDREDGNTPLTGNTRRGVLAGTAGFLSGCSGFLPVASEEDDSPRETSTSFRTGPPPPNGPPSTTQNTDTLPEETHSVSQTQQAKLTPTDGDVSDHFGGSVAFHGETAIIGAPRDDTPSGADAGSAYVFSQRDGEWVQQAKLIPDDGDERDYFGWSVAFDGETAVIGAPEDEDPNGAEAGSAYVFTQRTGKWRQQAKLTSHAGDSEDLFGWSVAIDGDTAVIGAPGNDLPNDDQADLHASTPGKNSPKTWGEAFNGEREVSLLCTPDCTMLPTTITTAVPNGEEAGAAYVFSRVDGDWTQQVKLIPEDADSQDEFGTSVAVDRETVVIGAPQDEDPNGRNAGSAYVFSLQDGGWSQQEKLTLDNHEPGGEFGFSVDLDGETVVIGAPTDEGVRGADGEAYLFSRRGEEWTQEANLIASDSNASDHFGESVALGGETVVIGAPGKEDQNGEDAGAAYMFSENTGQWTQEAKLIPEDVVKDDHFGRSLALDGKTAVIGAWLDDNPNGESAGSAYVFSLGDG